jgi:hypothetical protein
MNKPQPYRKKHHGILYRKTMPSQRHLSSIQFGVFLPPMNARRNQKPFLKPMP